jgi:hypothetical protein
VFLVPKFDQVVQKVIVKMSICEGVITAHHDESMVICFNRE